MTENALQTLLQHPLALKLGWTLLHGVWQGAAIAVLLMLGLALLPRGRADLRHGLATVALCAWLLAPVATWFSSGVFVSQTPVPVALSAEVTVAAPPAATPPAMSTEEVVATLPMTAAPDLDAPGATVASADLSARLLPVFALLWLVTATVLSVRFAGSLLFIGTLSRGGVPLGQLQDRLDSLIRQLGIRRPVRLLRSDRVDTPTAFGLLRPTLLLPASVMTGLSTQQLDLILAHELAHIRRHDYLVSLLQGVAEALLFFHPFTWWLSRLLRTEREHACDDIAMQQTGAGPLQLAATLARLESDRQATAPALAATGSLADRIRRLLSVPGRNRSRDLAMLPLLGLLLAGCWLALVNPVIAQTDSVSTSLIVIDAGHGGSDPGAQANGLLEADVTLAVALKLQVLLEEAGVRVLMTRSEQQDGNIDLTARLQATEAADALISIHTGASTIPSRRGVASWIHPEAFPGSHTLAESVQQSMVAATGGPDLAVRQLHSTLLAQAQLPGVMVEVGYLSNLPDARLLTDDDHLDLLAGSLARGLLQYLSMTHVQEPEFVERGGQIEDYLQATRADPQMTLPSVTSLATQADTVILTPTWLPAGFTFSNALWEQPRAYQLFESPGGGQISLLQLPADGDNELLPVPQDALILTTAVAGQYTEYSEGFWNGRDGTPVWQQLGTSALFWRQGNVLLGLVVSDSSFQGSHLAGLSQLRRIAESLVPVGQPDFTLLPDRPPSPDQVRRWITTVGDLIFSPDFSAVTGMAVDAMIVVEERGPEGMKRVVVTQAEGGQFQYDYLLDDQPAAFNETAQDWYLGLLEPTLLRFAAREQGLPMMGGGSFGRDDGYTSFLHGTPGRSMEFRFREPGSGNNMAAQVNATELERMAQAAAHGLLDQGALVALLSQQQVTRMPVDTEALNAAIYAARHVQDPDLRFSTVERLSQIGGALHQP